jgi:hypothetical protein
MTTALRLRQRELAVQAQAQRVRLAVQGVAWSGPLRKVDAVVAAIALARRHPVWTALAVAALVRVATPSRRDGWLPFLGAALRRWLGA